ncbi:hypothetical protein BH10PSE19_BH10PSE19_03190 [soil metagenome]
MTAIPFDTLKCLEKLTAAGVPGPQARVQVEIFAEVLQNNMQELVSEADLKESEAKLEAKIDKVDAKLDRVEAKLMGEITLLKWMLGFILAGIAALIGKIFFTL